jgi:hypothetical protein
MSLFYLEQEKLQILLANLLNDVWKQGVRTQFVIASMCVRSYLWREFPL